MSTPPFGLPGRFWRGNLHTHSQRSDGALPPEEVVRQYRDADYDFVAITDHFRPEYDFPITDTRALRTADFTTLLGAELHAPRTELGSQWHILAVGLPRDFAPPEPDETGPALARRAREAGAFIGMAHPAASLLTLQDAESLDAAHAVETHNALSAMEDRGESWHFYDVLLGRGHRINAYAADDAHGQPGDPPGLRAWVHVRAETLEPESLVTALKSGEYYSSTGPEIHDIQVSDTALTVRCSPVDKVVVTATTPGKQLRADRNLTECTIPLATLPKHHPIRVTIVDRDGQRAWSNPIFTRD